jgi:hypothetical protein
MKGVLIFSLILISSNTYSQINPIDVVDNTLKVPALGDEEFYYAFAEGDQVIFNFEEVKGKELKEVEIIEWPSSSKFMDYKTKRISNKILNITSTGIYKFRFSNSSITARICKFKIQRIPATETSKNFNTSVFWKAIADTTYYPIVEKYLVKSDTVIQTVVDQTAKVSSQNALNGNSNKTIVDFNLPEGTISWSFYLGTGSESKKEFNEARQKFINAAASLSSSIPGYGTMGALALHGINYFNQIQGEDNVKYYFITNWDNVLAFNNGKQFYQYKQGDVVNDASQMKSPISGKVYLGLINDNIMEPIEVVIKVSAVIINQEWENRTVNKMSVQTHSEPYFK